MIHQPALLTAVLEQLDMPHTPFGGLDTVALGRVTDDSRAVRAGDVYVAVRGVHHDGHGFLDAVARAGAAAALVEDREACPAGLPGAVVTDTRAALARLRYLLGGVRDLQRRGELALVGITGTNGKSTTCGVVRDILRRLGRPCACLGTIEYDLVGRRREAPWTTPPADHLAECLREAHAHGAGHAVMEVSSHALDQRRTAGLDFAVGVFTNLTGDHLDYHETTADYLAAKKRLFDGLSPDACAVVNADDAHGEAIVGDCPAPVMRFGFRRHAEVRAEDLACGLDATRFRWVAPGWSGAVSIPLIGRHNVANVLAAGCVARALGADWDDIAHAATAVDAVPGRLQPAHPAGHPYAVFVDYAHTDDALDNVLTALRPLTLRSLWCVFGCGGDRDRSKRPRMAAVTARLADRVVVTSDNPRTEDPQRIADDIISGFEPARRDHIAVELDRARAIELALSNAAAGDVVLIAGKGHEDYQIIGQERRYFDDVETVHACLHGDAAAGGA